MEAMASWLAGLRPRTQVEYRRSVELLGQSLGGGEAEGAAALLGDPGPAAAAVKGLAALIEGAGQAPATVRMRVTGCVSLARWGGHDLGLRRPRGRRPGELPRPRPVDPDAAGRRQAAGIGAAAALDGVTRWAPSLARAADRRGQSVAEFLASSVGALAAEGGPAIGLLRAAARELAVMAGDEVAERGMRRRDRRARAPAPARVPTIEELEAKIDAELAELERVAKAQEATNVE